MDGSDDITAGTKACTRCGLTKSAAEFSRKSASRDGLQSACKGCERARGAAWRAANPDRHSATNKAWYEANRERKLAQNAAWKKANPERYADAIAKWRRSNPDRIHAYEAAYRSAHGDRARAASAAWSKANAPKVRARNAAYRAARPEWTRSQYALGKAMRRARKASAPVVERIYRAKVWGRDGGRCHICGRKADPNNWHLEHIVPLAAGGEHSYRNVAVAHPACNLRKGVRGPAQARLLP